MFDQGKLEKMTLRAYKPAKDPKAPPQVSNASADMYVVQVNPSSYTLSHLLEYNRHRGQGFSGSQAVYSGSPPVNLQFEFLFDGTGIVPKPSEVGDIPLVGALASALSGGADKPFDVMKELEDFKNLVYAFYGGMHRPRQLLLTWGSLALSCVLTSLNYRFTLFKPDGTPLRAIAACSFCESIPDAERVRKENPNSPDLTHLRDVREGDTLPLLANDIYGTPQLYLEVARANKLINFRRLRAASRLSFPPLDKGVKA